MKCRCNDSFDCGCTWKEVPLPPKLDLTKPIKLRNGYKVEININALNDNYLLGHYYHNAKQDWVAARWNKNGKHTINDPSFDIVNVEPEVYQYLNVYVNHREQLEPGANFNSKKEADDSAYGRNNRVGCMKIKLERRFDE